MKGFAALYQALDQSTKTNSKVDALVAYFRSAPVDDAAWATYFLAGGRPKQTVPSRVLRDAAMVASGLSDWLFEESYQAVGDMAETIALVLPEPTHRSDLGLAGWMEQRLLPLRGLPPEEVTAALFRAWDELDAAERFLYVKLIGGGFRVGVSRLLVTRALSIASGIDPKYVAERLVGYTDIRTPPTVERYLALIAPMQADGVAPGDAAPSAVNRHPFPFFLAHALQTPTDELPALLGDPGQWLIEWKYDGIRAQIVKRGGALAVWSRGEELITDRFPELAALAEALPDGTVLDGEIVVWSEGRPAPFALLQTRIGRKNVSAKVLREAPVVLIAYDLLELGGQDLRAQVLNERRALLERLVAELGDPRLLLSPEVTGADWSVLDEERQQSRSRRVEGFMVKARDSRYGIGRTKDAGVWWKWKVDPYQVDAVLIYAQRGHGRRASLYTDYTFAVWDRAPDEPSPRTLIPFAKAYSGLTDEEIRQVDAIIRKTTVEQFGPVRSVVPTLVFELGFEGLQRSSRHKSGIAVRFPRMLRWRQDKPVEEADTLAMLEAMIDSHAG